MSDVSISFLFDTTLAEAQLAEMQGKIDAQQADWAQKRREMLTELRNIAMGINLVVQTIRMAVRVTGQVLSPLYNALLSLVSSVTSVIIATATAMAAGSLGLLTGAALALAGIAFELQLITTVKIIAAQEETQAAFASINARLAQMHQQVIAQGSL